MQIHEIGNKPTSKTQEPTTQETSPNIFEMYAQDANVVAFTNEEPTIDLQVERKFEIKRVPNKAMVRMPREDKDHRVRAWTHEEIVLCVKLYNQGKSMHHIAKLIGCSHAPLAKMLNSRNVLSKNHKVAYAKMGYLGAILKDIALINPNEIK